MSDLSLRDRRDEAPVKQMVTPKVAAAMLGGIDRDTVFRWIKAGKLKASKPSPRIVLVYVSSINDLLERSAL